MSSMNFNHGEGWREYQKQIQQSQQKEGNPTEEDLKDPLSQQRKQDHTFVFSTAFIVLFREALTERWAKLLKQADTSMVILALQEAFQDLKSLFQTLSQKDTSMDVSFLNELSVAWEKLEQASGPLKHKPEGIGREISEPLFTFLFSISNCKEGQQYPLVHYLKEHAGVDWVPFPFMAILRKLHEEYLERRRTSLLGNWLDQIELILNSSQKSPEL